jgi:hypothetical protein
VTTIEALQTWAQSIVGKHWKVIVTRAVNEDVVEIRLSPWAHACITVDSEQLEDFMLSHSENTKGELLAAREELLRIL